MLARSPPDMRKGGHFPWKFWWTVEVNCNIGLLLLLHSMFIQMHILTLYNVWQTTHNCGNLNFHLVEILNSSVKPLCHRLAGNLILHQNGVYWSSFELATIIKRSNEVYRSQCIKKYPLQDWRATLYTATEDFLL